MDSPENCRRDSFRIDFFVGPQSIALLTNMSETMMIEGERSLVLEWLRNGQREPHFLEGRTEAELALDHAVIAERFVWWIRKSGFEAKLVEALPNAVRAWDVHWTHQGATFVGFKQAPPAADPADALLLGCAALLRNDWCRRHIV